MHCFQNAVPMTIPDEFCIFVSPDSRSARLVGGFIRYCRSRIAWVAVPKELADNGNLILLNKKSYNTISFSISTFVLAQPGRATFYICLQ